MMKPRKKPVAKLRLEDVLVIRQALLAGVSKAVLARRYNVTTSAIYKVEKRRSWK